MVKVITVLYLVVAVGRLLEI